MSIWQSRPILRWLVPAAAALAVVGGGAGIGALRAAAGPSLPPRDASALLVDLQTARVNGLSGTVVQRADLGLPALAGLSGVRGGSSDLTSLLSGTHTLRVWYAGPDTARIALLGTLGETDVIRNGRDLWLWSSRENTATHRTLPAPRDTPTLPPATGLPLTPQQLADAALAAVDPTTIVTTEDSVRVAGRDAYELVLAPRDSASLVARITIAIDATQHVPLRVRVYAQGYRDPALEVAFTTVSFAQPQPAQFVFNPPPGATVVQGDTVVQRDRAGPGADRPHPGAAATSPGLAVVGSGWTTVLVVRTPDAGAAAGQATAGRPGAAAGPGSPDPGLGSLARMVNQLPRVAGAWGSGHLLTSYLFSVLVTDDGRLLVGAVAPQRLYQAAADPAAKVGP
jgi:outer membrane lipoprotein-sorting protein